MNNFNLSLFIKHLNEGLSNTSDMLEAVCDIIVMHFFVDLKLIDSSGIIIIDKQNQGESQKRVIPITTLGKLILSRSTDFSNDEALGIDIALGPLIVLLKTRKDNIKTNRIERINKVRATVNTLSFSELEAATLITKAFETNEGLINAGKIAKELNISRSVITSTLRKLESSGLLEARSLGMKGTYVRIKDQILIDELRKL